MKRLLILAILATLASSAGCNFCKRFCSGPPAAQPCAQPVYSACPPVEACSPCSTGSVMPTPVGVGG